MASKGRGNFGRKVKMQCKRYYKMKKNMGCGGSIGQWGSFGRKVKMWCERYKMKKNWDEGENWAGGGGENIGQNVMMDCKRYYKKKNIRIRGKK